MESKASIVHSIPLTLKVFIVSLFVGVSVWGVLDYYENRSVKHKFEKHMLEMLDRQSQEDRLRFFRSVDNHGTLVKLLVGQKNFIDYINTKNWNNDDSEIKEYIRPPKWYLSRTILHALVAPRYAFLLSGNGRIKELYHRRNDPIAKMLLTPDLLLLQKSLDVTHIAIIDQLPYLLATGSVTSKEGEQVMVLFATPLDAEFLNKSQGDFPNRLVALVSSDQQTIMTSNNPELLPAGSDLKNYRKEYVITKREYHDFGGAETAIDFVTLIPTAKIEKLAHSFVIQGRQHRAITAFAFILSFMVILFWLTKRIIRLNIRVNAFATNALGGSTLNIKFGDQLYHLEQRFSLLIEEVIAKKKQLEDINIELTRAMDTIRETQEDLISAEKLAVVGQMSGLVAHEVLNPISAVSIRIEKNIDRTKQALEVLNKMGETVNRITDNIMQEALNNECRQDIDLLCKITAALTKEQNERYNDLNFFIRNIDRIIKIIDGLRQMSKKERYIENVDIDLIIKEVVADMADSYQKRGISVNMDIAPVPPIRADYIEIYSVITNLLRNAIQAVDQTHKSEKTVSITVSSCGDDNIELLVKDCGIGIEKELWETIFETGFTTKGREGTGLGLSYIRKVARSYHGDIIVKDSTIGKGTTFQVLLPLDFQNKSAS